MGTRAALVTGTAMSSAVTAVWSYSATLSIGPAVPLHLTARDLPGDYMQLGAAATGSTPVALFAVITVIYAACLFASGWRHLNRKEAG